MLVFHDDEVAMMTDSEREALRTLEVARERLGPSLFEPMPDAIIEPPPEIIEPFDVEIGEPLPPVSRIIETKPIGARGDHDGNDMVNCYYLLQAEQARRTVARIASASGTPRGTGFLVGPHLLMTNQHVIRTKWGAKSAFAEFDYLKPPKGKGTALPLQRHKLDPSKFFYSNSAYDFVLVYIEQESDKGAPLIDRGWNPLRAEPLDPEAARRVNIIQHPEGREQHIALRENKLVDLSERRPSKYLHYHADTMHMSSGSPVWDDNWDLIAIHHSAIPSLPLTHPTVWEANEGVRMSAIAERILEDGASHYIHPVDYEKYVQYCFVKPDFVTPLRVFTAFNELMTHLADSGDGGGERPGNGRPEWTKTWKRFGVRPTRLSASRSGRATPRTDS